MTEITHEALEALSKAAASGTLTHAGWGDGSTQMGMTNIFNEDHEVCLMECIPEEDAAFICALWNAYRTGQLILAQPSGDEVEAVAINLVNRQRMFEGYEPLKDLTLLDNEDQEFWRNEATAAIAALDAHRGKQACLKARENADG